MKNLLLLITGLLFFSSLTYPQDITINETPSPGKVLLVDVTQPWTDTGIDIITNDSVAIIVEGVASTTGGGGSPQNRLYWVGPEGFGGNVSSGNPVPSAANYSVIGKIGNSGTPFYVGKVISFKPNIPGRLYLGFNDEVFFDNYGYYVAYIFARLTITDAFNPSVEVPSTFGVSQNYPNPFNPNTTIRFEISKQANLEIKVYDIAGKLVRNLVNGVYTPGSFQIVWDGKDEGSQPVSSGTYIYQILADHQIIAKKMILMK